MFSPAFYATVVTSTLSRSPFLFARPRVPFSAPFGASPGSQTRGRVFFVLYGRFMGDPCPQKEHGYTPIANEIMDALIASDLKIPPDAMKVLLLILRETYGCSRKSAIFKRGHIAARTGIFRTNVSRALRQLKGMKLINVIQTDNITEVSFNKNYKLWRPFSVRKVLSKRIPLSKRITSVIQMDTPSIKQPLKQPKDILSAEADSPPPQAGGSAGEVKIANNGLPYAEVVAYLNEKSHKQFKPNSKKTRAFIKARFGEGFTLEDFKTVIDNKAGGWLNDPEMDRFLRPETLFGTKFEGYLNEKKETRRPTFDDERKFLP